MMNIRELANTKENIEFTLDILKRMKPHEDIEVYKQQTKDGFFGMRAAVSALVLHLQPEIYMEIGIGLGCCMSLAVARCPNIYVYGFDVWQDFTWSDGDKSPSSPKLVVSEIVKFRSGNSAGHTLLSSGDSAITVPNFLNMFSDKDPFKAQLIVIDAEHTVMGKSRDWLNCATALSKGGYMITYGMDPGVYEPAWDMLQEKYPEWGYKIIDRMGLVYRKD